MLAIPFLKMVKNYCCVPSCHSRDKQGIILHRIPKDENRQELFANAIQRQNWIPSYNSRICEVKKLVIVFCILWGKNDSAQCHDIFFLTATG